MQIHEVRGIYPDKKKCRYRGIDQFIDNIYYSNLWLPISMNFGQRIRVFFSDFYGVFCFFMKIKRRLNTFFHP
jgi:hypothetical protein